MSEEHDPAKDAHDDIVSKVAEDTDCSFIDEDENIALLENKVSEVLELAREDSIQLVKAPTSLSKGQRMIEKMCKFYPEQFSTMITQDQDKLINLVKTLSEQFTACNNIDEQLSLITKANFIANCLVNLYPFNTNNEHLRRLIIMNFEVLANEKYPVSKLNAM